MSFISETSHPYFKLHKLVTSALSELDKTHPTYPTYLIQSIISAQLHVSSLLITRSQSSLSTFKFSPGDVVYHKLFNYRGVIYEGDPLPRGNVENWDGLKGVRDLEQPFYIVIPDKNDMRNQFGAGRDWRYVVEENLEEHEGRVEVEDMWLKTERLVWDDDFRKYLVGSQVEIRNRVNEDIHKETVQVLEEVDDTIQTWMEGLRKTEGAMEPFLGYLKESRTQFEGEQIKLFLMESVRAIGDRKVREEWRNITLAIKREGGGKKSRDMVEAFLKTNKDYEEGWNHKAILLKSQASGETSDGEQSAEMKVKILQEAVEVIDEKVLPTADYHIMARVGKGRCHEQLKEWDKAMAAMDGVLEVDPWFSASKSYYNYWGYERMKEKEENGKAGGEGGEGWPKGGDTTEKGGRGGRRSNFPKNQ